MNQKDLIGFKRSVWYTQFGPSQSQEQGSLGKGLWCVLQSLSQPSPILS